MKKLFFILITLFFTIGAYCQTKYILPYDSVILTKPNGTGYTKSAKGIFTDTLFLAKLKYTDGNQSNEYVLTSDANGNAHWAANGGGGGGNTNSNVGTGYRWAIPGTNNVKTFLQGYGLVLDSAANTLSARVDTFQIPTRYALYKSIDSLAALFVPAGNYGNLQINRVVFATPANDSLTFDGLFKTLGGARIGAFTGTGSPTLRVSGIGTNPILQVGPANYNFPNYWNSIIALDSNITTTVGLKGYGNNFRRISLIAPSTNLTFTFKFGINNAWEIGLPDTINMNPQNHDGSAAVLNALSFGKSSLYTGNSRVFTGSANDAISATLSQVGIFTTSAGNHTRVVGGINGITSYVIDETGSLLDSIDIFHGVEVTAAANLTPRIFKWVDFYGGTCGGCNLISTHTDSAWFLQQSLQFGSTPFRNELNSFTSISTDGLRHVATNTLELYSASNGALKIVDGTQSNGYVFTSDANGLGTWQPASVSSSLFPTTGTGTATGNVFADMNGNDLLINNGVNVTIQGSGSMIFGSTGSGVLNLSSSGHFFEDDNTIPVGLQYDGDYYSGQKSTGCVRCLIDRGTAQGMIDSLGSSSITINSTAITSGTSTRILFQNASNQVSQASTFTFNTTANILQVNGTYFSQSGTRNTFWNYAGIPAGITGVASDNTGIGFATLSSLTGGTANSSFGTNAGTACTTCSNFTFFSPGAGASVTDATAGVYIGTSAGGTANSSYSTLIGTLSNNGNVLTNAIQNILIGYAIAPVSNQDGYVSIGNAIFANGATSLGSTPGGRVGIGTNSPVVSSLLDLTSTVQGFLPPRMTTTQQNAISSPAEGLQIYDNVLHRPGIRDNSAWQNLAYVSDLTAKQNILTVASDATDADFSIAINSIKYLPSATLSTNRTITIPAGSNGDYIEIYNNEAGFLWNISGSAIYLADGVTTISSLLANTNYILRKVSGKWRILN